ncbi:MAG: hypothetical protein QXS20_08860 [Candidatus Thorarchaeota archaeon]
MHFRSCAYCGTLLSSPALFKAAGLLAGSSVYASVRFLIYFMPLFFLMTMSLTRIDELTYPTLRCIALATVLVVITWLWNPLMGYNFRFLFPALVPVVLLSTKFSSELLAIATRARPYAIRSLRDVYVSLWRLRYAVPIPIVLVAPASGVGVVYRTAMDYSQGLQNTHIAIGHYLRQNAPPGATVAVGDAGAIPYYSGLRAIDTFGLLMPGVYNETGYDADYVFVLEPDYIVIISAYENELAPILPSDTAIVNHPSFALYSPIGVYTFRSGHHLWLMAR